MRVRVKHETRYEYERPAAFGPHLVRLRPAGHVRAEVLSYNLAVEPTCQLRWQQDPWNNRVARLSFDEGLHDSLRIVVDLTLDVRPVNPFDFWVDDRCRKLPFRYPDGLENELAPFLRGGTVSPRLASFLEGVPCGGYSVDDLVALNRAVAARVRYVIRNEPGLQTSDETLKVGSGSCRDSACLLVDALRARGLAARFVSGYLLQLADEGIIPDEAKGIDRDVVDLHAWAEVYIPGAGWIGLDGTSGLLCGEGHVPLASAVTPELASPVTGTTSAPASGFFFEMRIARLGHEPRPRRPYEDDTWRQILVGGKLIDRVIDAHGVKLTAGGEPTWTSRLHSGEPEWKTEALGPTKWQQGLHLASELRRRLGHGTFMIRKMGKQYPGESLPRWAIQLLWRKDGVPVWRDPSLLDDGARSAVPGTSLAFGSLCADLPATLDRARAFGERFMTSLEVEGDLVPAYEDPWYFVKTEQDLPPDVDLSSADHLGDEDRRRLARILERGVGGPIGFALPLQWWNARWISSRWKIRRGRLFLVPGDSPIGLRLPLERLGGRPLQVHPADTTAITNPEIGFDPRLRRVFDASERSPAVEQSFASGETVLKTALCLEPRDGVLHVFLPPVPTIEAFLELVARIEDTARELGTPVCVEGYGPPPDPRIESCAVTPDPGVLEVNLPVTSSFEGYLGVMETIAEAANHAGLSMEKYQLDGREVGSGGGNHLTLGGPSTIESPFLSRPILLGSLLRYLQNHPSLSYLFTGIFVGPTSQAPRIDEARHDALYELELALAQIPRSGEPVFPWQTDRLLRNLLVDVAGNTHRIEVCVDKLYAPEGPAGRLGILELRAFEMPPNERMAAVQMLLARALVARFLLEPYEAPLVRWGTELHDRFMLPHFLWKDISDVAHDLSRVGLPVDAEWFRPFLDYRFPLFGRFTVDGVTLEIRTALEPWPTLGDEPVGAVVARYVDSSLERLEVKAFGLTEGRHAVAVNGIELPMHPTGMASERVAGVRFRAWQPPNCLQPGIGVHHPLRFDIVDTWGKRSLGACSYHVWHSEGRAFEEPPLTAFEAAARRAQRFTTQGHAPWPVVLRRSKPHPEHPLTLDLRAQGILPET